MKGAGNTVWLRCVDMTGNIGKHFKKTQALWELSTIPTHHCVQFDGTVIAHFFYQMRLNRHNVLSSDKLWLKVVHFKKVFSLKMPYVLD